MSATPKRFVRGAMRAFQPGFKDWADLNREELEHFARFQGECFGPFPDATWFFEPAFKVGELVTYWEDGIWGKEKWSKWIRDMTVVDGYNFDALYKLWLADPLLVGPVVIAEDYPEGKPDAYVIGDGNHRIALAFANDWETIPAIVGR